MRNGTPPKLTELRELKEGEKELFAGVQKEEYEEMAPHQRYLLAQWNCCSLKELDEEYGVTTEIPDEKEMVERARKNSQMVLKMMREAGLFDDI